MTRYSFDTNLHELNNELLRMGSVFEKQIYHCIEALANQDCKLADQIIKNDDIVVVHCKSSNSISIYM